MIPTYPTLPAVTDPEILLVWRRDRSRHPEWEAFATLLRGKLTASEEIAA